MTFITHNSMCSQEQLDPSWTGVRAYFKSLQ